MRATEQALIDSNNFGSGDGTPPPPPPESVMRRKPPAPFIEHPTMIESVIKELGITRDMAGVAPGLFWQELQRRREEESPADIFAKEMERQQKLRTEVGQEQVEPDYYKPKVSIYILNQVDGSDRFEAMRQELVAKYEANPNRIYETALFQIEQVRQKRNTPEQAKAILQDAIDRFNPKTDLYHIRPIDTVTIPLHGAITSSVQPIKGSIQSSAYLPFEQNPESLVNEIINDRPRTRPENNLIVKGIYQSGEYANLLRNIRQGVRDKSLTKEAALALFYEEAPKIRQARQKEVLKKIGYVDSVFGIFDFLKPRDKALNSETGKSLHETGKNIGQGILALPLGIYGGMAFNYLYENNKAAANAADEVRARGGSLDEQIKAAYEAKQNSSVESFIAAAPVLDVAMKTPWAKNLVAKFGNDVGKWIISEMILPAAENASKELAKNAYARSTYDTDRELFENVASSIAQSFISPPIEAGAENIWKKAIAR